VFIASVYIAIVKAKTIAMPVSKAIVASVTVVITVEEFLIGPGTHQMIITI